MWEVHSGASARYLWFVSRGSHEYLQTAAGKLRRFATRENAQRAADKLNREQYGSPEMLSAKRHVGAAIQMITRATRDAAGPHDSRFDIVDDLFAVWHKLGGPRHVS